MDDFVDLINFLLKIEEFRNIVEKKQSFNQFRVNDVVEILDVLNVFEDPIVENALNYVVKKFPESSEIILFYTNYQIQNKRIKKAKQALKFLKSSELENPLFYILTISVHLLESNFNKARVLLKRDYVTHQIRIRNGIYVIAARSLQNILKRLSLVSIFSKEPDRLLLLVQKYYFHW